MKIIVATSTFHGGSRSNVPRFVDEQIFFLKKNYPELEFVVLAPHVKNTKNFYDHEYYSEYRFHYFWPHSYETLAGRGIVPALKENKLRYFLIPFYFGFQFITLLKLTRKIKPDLIYAHWFTPQGINAGLVSLLTGVPFAFMNHASDVIVLKKIPWLGSWIVRFLSKRAAAVTTSGNRTMQRFKQFFNERNFKEVNIRIIPMGINLENYSQPRQTKEDLKKEYCLQNKKVILFLGRLVEVKGIVYLLRAYRILQNEHTDLILIIAGEGQQRSELEEYVTHMNINDKVKFTGFISVQTKMDYLHLSDIIVIPSLITKSGHGEGLPIVLMEGLATGKLIVATYESNADEVITNGENGFLIGQKDPMAIVDAVNQILHMDEAQKNAMASRAKESAKAFDWNEIVKRHYDFVFHKPDSQP